MVGTLGRQELGFESLSVQPMERRELKNDCHRFTRHIDPVLRTWVANSRTPVKK